MYHVRESDRRWWVLPTVSLVIAICASLLVWLYDLDLIVATWMQSWNTSHGGRLQDRWWGQVGFYLPMIMSVALGLGGVAALLIGLLRPAHQALIRPALFVVLCLAIGPGLIANAMLKDHWGRPRPRETIELGGSWAYLGPWVKGPAGRGKSFPCGHATVPALGVALWLLWRRNRPALARGCLIGGVVLTLFVGGLRMLAGGHWLSDVLWAAALMVVVSATLHRLIALVPERAQALPGSERVRWLVVGGVAVAGMAILAGVLLATPFYRELKAGLSPAQLGGGRWRLEVEADVGDVVIDLRSAALAASPAL
jgi:membrane-associated PAP2 superfamily phosphatase